MTSDPFKPAALFYEFTRRRVQRCDFTHFKKYFGVEQLPHGHGLRAYCDSLVIAVQGYDSDPRELYEIPEVRSFYQAFYREWPFWWFACCLDAPNLFAMTFGCLDTLQVVKRDADSLCQIVFSRSELAQFVLRGFAPMNYLCARSGMTEAEVFQRSQQVFEYFQKDWSAFARG